MKGINGTYVDDFLRVGDDEFRELCAQTYRRFDTSGDDETPLIFSGFRISVGADGTLTMEQSFYLKELEESGDESDFSSYRSMRMKAAWHANTRPDLLFEISQLAQIT